MESYMDFDDSKIRLIRVTRLHASEGDSNGRTDLSKLTNTLSSLLLSFLFFSFPFLILTEMRPLFDGTSGHVGFVRRRGCYRNACYNEEGSDPETLGNDIINFIISHTAQELEELKGIVDKVSPLSNTLIYPILMVSARMGLLGSCRENVACRSTTISHRTVTNSTLVPVTHESYRPTYRRRIQDRQSGFSLEY
jgi:hypothetical protein